MLSNEGNLNEQFVTVAGGRKGIYEMKALGLITSTPKLLAVQAAGAAPVTAAFLSGETLKPIEARSGD